jgi:ABC-2 type transport system ATP-binding protein
VADGLVIETADLRKSYGRVEALRGLSLQVRAGSICGFLGRNGAGKTTTIKILLGMARPTGGQARVFGLAADAQEPSVEIRRRTGFVGDDKDLYDYMTVEDMIRFTARFFSRWRADLEQRYLRKFELPPDRRVKTVFFSSHQIAEVDQIADHVIIIERGHAVVTGALDDLRERYRRIQLVFDGDAPAVTFRAPGAERTQRKGRMLTVLSSAAWPAGRRAGRPGRQLPRLYLVAVAQPEPEAAVGAVRGSAGNRWTARAGVQRRRAVHTVVAGLADALVHGVCMLIAGSTLFSLTFLLSTVFTDVWRPPLIALCFAILMSPVRQVVGGPSSASLQGVMTAEIYFRGDGLPWPGLLLCTAVSSALLYVATLNMARHDF